MSSAVSTFATTTTKRLPQLQQEREKRVTPKSTASVSRGGGNASTQTRMASGQTVNKRENSKKGSLQRLNNLKRTQPFRMNLQRNSRTTRDAKLRQLLNTYLTFAYEMGPGMEVKYFAKYVILIMYSMDQIAKSSRNTEVYKKLYDQVGSITGVVDLKIQQQFATLITGYLRNVEKIKGNTSALLYKSLNQNVLRRQNKSLNTV